MNPPPGMQNPADSLEITMHKLSSSVLLAAATLSASAGAAPSSPPRSGHQLLGGVNYYYELRGKGEPLLLLHGGLGTFEMFGPVLEKLSENHTVICVDLQGHGRSTLGDRPFKLEPQGDDMAALVKKLGFEKVDVMGYSLGSGVAFQVAVRHPEVVRKLVLVSSSYSDDGFYPELRAQQSNLSAAAMPMMKETPMYKGYVAVAPNPNDFPKLLDSLGTYMKGHFDYSEDVKKLSMPVMLVWGDSDMFRPEHMVKFYQLLGGGLKDAGWMRENMSKNRWAVIPDATHYDIFSNPRLAQTVQPFLDGKSDAKSWSEQVDANKKK